MIGTQKRWQEDLFVADTIDLTFAADVKEVEAVNWLDGTPGKLALNGTRASLRIYGGTGVLIKAKGK